MYVGPSDSFQTTIAGAVAGVVVASVLVMILVFIVMTVCFRLKIKKAITSMERM